MRINHPATGSPGSTSLAAFAFCAAAMWACCSSVEAAPVVEEPMKLTAPDREDEFPAIGCAADGRVWVAWVSYDGQQDEILVKPMRSEAGPISLSGTAGDCWRPAMERDGDGRLWVTWPQNENGNWDVWTSYLKGANWSAPIRLTTNPANDMCQQLARDTTGRLWMTWQAVVEKNYEVLIARITPQGLVDQRNVSRHPANDWEPAIAADCQGGIVVGWDSYRHGSYDILTCGLNGDGELGEAQLIAASQNYEAHATLAVDRQNRVWIAWDNGGPDWGQHGQPRLKLHSRRSVHLRCFASQRLWKTNQDLSEVLAGKMSQFCELPRLRVDGSGRLWLFIRHLENLTPPGMRKVGNRMRPYQTRGIWNPYALCYVNGQWTTPVILPSSNGRNDMRVATCLDSAGQVFVAWTEDQRKPARAEEPGNHEVYAAKVGPAASSSVSLPVLPAEKKLPAPNPVPDSRAIRPNYAFQIQGVDYSLRYGDTHRHTDISRCGMNQDGSLMDTYRYAIDAAGLDFLAISDHDQDLLKHRYGREQQGPLQDYAWWRSQKYCDLFYIADRFLPIYGYEHGGSYRARGGHKNVLYVERGLPCYEENSPKELFHVLRDKEVVVIPHQLADGGSATDWGKWNADFERVAEIFQARGSYEYLGAPLIAAVQREGFYLQDALEGGVRIGVIASSDHGLVHGAYAGIYAKEFTRRGVLEALRSRRSFGATEMMVLDLRIGDRLLGEEATLDTAPTFRATAQGIKPLDLVEMVRDGNIVYSTRPEKTACSFQFTDTAMEPGTNAYYYLRAMQQDKQWAWSSAIWVRRQE
ncbi:MAG: hypothetical protein ACC645_11555 [Pirellulales bacterium]